MALFDDDENNVKIGRKSGYHVHYCKALSSKEADAGGQTGFNRDVWKEFIIAKGLTNKSCMLM